MQIAHVELWLTPNHCINKFGVTPAEHLLLGKLHASNNGTIRKTELIGDVERTSAEELNRLLQHYRAEFVNSGQDAMWPGATPVLPQTFSDVGIATTPYIAPDGAPPITSFPQPEEWGKVPEDSN